MVLKLHCCQGLFLLADNKCSENTTHNKSSAQSTTVGVRLKGSQELFNKLFESYLIYKVIHS